MQQTLLKPCNRGAWRHAHEHDVVAIRISNARLRSREANTGDRWQLLDFSCYGVLHSDHHSSISRKTDGCRSHIDLQRPDAHFKSLKSSRSTSTITRPAASRPR